MIYKAHKTPFSELTVEARSMMENQLKLDSAGKWVGPRQEGQGDDCGQWPL